MTHRIAVASTIEDARARGYLKTLKGLFPTTKLSSVSCVQSYTLDTKLTSSQLKKVGSQLVNPLIEAFTIDKIPTPQSYAYAIEIGYLPGVTDNVGHTVQEMIEESTGRPFKADEHVYTSSFLFLVGKLSREEVEKMAQELFNPLIERATVFAAGEKLPVVVPKVLLHESPVASEVDLNIPDTELEELGKRGIKNADGSRRGPLSLSLKQISVIRDHFATLKRKPTDVELESLAQTWSEHCKHTIFSDPLDDIKEGIYRTYIKGATEKIRKEKGDKDFCVSVFKDNSGAIAFDDEYLITHKVETHNSPSGLDPFGGSVTAIVGVNRDCLGFGLGAKPIANTYGFCVADPSDATALFRDEAHEQPLLPARRILEGVVRGINAGGNQSGIPTPLGFLAVDPSYRGKPLVFGGTVGLIPRKKGSRKLYEKKAQSGDYIVMIGGRVGADGIHGATFSSESLSSGSPATAVQIGDPITQKKLSDAIIREARDAGLYSSITDNGAGGLSGAVGEMSREAGGCIVDLETVPLKYSGLSPWQIWISESQERMTLAVPKAKWTVLKKIFDRHDVEATRIGTFTKSGNCVVRYKKKVVMNMSLAFLHEGRPIEIQQSAEPKRTLSEPSDTERAADLGASLLAVLSRPSVGSTLFISQQYDFEVQGSSVTKPLQGRGRVNADAAVIRPLSTSPKGAVLSHGYAPWYSHIDTYKMAAAAIDTAVRNAVCAGASLDYLAILDNFCWSSSDTPERLFELKEAARACFDLATAYGTPFISGKDSMFNDFRGFNAAGEKVHIAALPTLLISALGVMPDISKAMTIDFKQVGDLVYLIGETNDELGASEYFATLGDKSGSVVPVVDAAKNAAIYKVLAGAIQNDLVASALGVGRGGLGVAIAKSAIAGKLGMEADLTKIAGSAKKADAILFSESQGRVLVSVRRSVQKQFEGVMAGVSCTQIGEVVQAASVSLTLAAKKGSIPLDELTAAYRSFFKDW